MMYVIRAFGRSLRAFMKDEGFHLSASISYFLIVSLVPLSLLIVTLFGYLMGENPDLYQFALSRLISFFPSVTEGITAELKNLITFKGISAVTFFIYCFLSLQLFYSMEHAMNVIFNIPKRRHFFISLLWSILIVTLVIIFLVFAFTLSSFAGLFHKHSVNIFGVAVGIKFAILLKYIVPYLLVMLVFTAIFMIVPQARVRPSHAMLGALLVTTFWEVGKHFFTWYVKHTVYFGTIYGSLTTFILALLWVYYSSCIVLLGGEFVYHLHTGGRVKPPLPSI
jgi:membrane protein